MYTTLLLILIVGVLSLGGIFVLRRASKSFQENSQKEKEMITIKTKGYRGLEEWEDDMEFFRKNPNDRTLLSAIITRMNNTDPELKDTIDTHIQDYMLEYTPMYLLKKISKENPDSFIIVKSKEDIWFDI